MDFTLLDIIDTNLALIDDRIAALEAEKHRVRGTLQGVKLTVLLLALQQKRTQLENERITLD